MAMSLADGNEERKDKMLARLMAIVAASVTGMQR